MNFPLESDVSSHTWSYEEDNNINSMAGFYPTSGVDPLVVGAYVIWYIGLLANSIIHGYEHSIQNPHSIRSTSQTKRDNLYYIVIIDAGSTGSRVNAFKFKLSHNSDLELKATQFNATNPGLGSYVENPNEGAESILNLVELAYDLVPPQYRAVTPVFVRATGGLRILDARTANTLLEAVRQALRTTQFLITPDAVEIMSGYDEGINAWISLNFLENTMDKKTSAVMDLGGETIEVTYESKRNPTRFLNHPSLNRSFPLFTYSYPSLGQVAVSHAVLMQESRGNRTHITSQCFKSSVQNQPITFRRFSYFVSGSQGDSETKWRNCLTLVRRAMRKLLSGHPKPTKDLIKSHIDGIGGFLIPVVGDEPTVIMEDQKMVRVSDFLRSSRSQCKTASVIHEKPWRCINSITSYYLLTQLVGLSPKKKIHVVKKLGGVHVSWSLGLAYDILLDRIAATNSNLNKAKLTFRMALDDY